MINRIAFFDSVLYWFSGAIFKLMLLAAPILFWFTGTSVIRAGASDLLYWLAPAIGANFLFMYWVTEKHVLPVLTDVTQFLTIFAVARTVLTALFRPFGHSFKVTTKGIYSSGFFVQWDVLWRFAAIAILTVSGMLLHISDFSPSHSQPGYALTVFWSIANAFLLFLASVVCVEPPKRRLDERFSTSEPAIVLLNASDSIPCRLHDLSLGGACLVREDGWRNLVGRASVSLDHGRIVIPFDVVRRNGPRLALKFHPDRAVRRLLIVHLFTGTYHQDVESISVPQVFRTLAKVLVS
ncbi:MAG TPA: PilZ domain-containing protein [Verrucomicrobiae bacterium]|nr:PilZ domain-containing protein [Verrucomicrobiae bacterium]